MLPNKEIYQNDSEYNTRQRLESCTAGIQQLETLRLKHKLLMEQIRRDYPSMNSLIKSLGSGDETDPIAQNSPNSVCSLTPSHVSDDSGYAQNNSGGSLGLSDNPMDYNTFRKLSLEEYPAQKSVRPTNSHIVEATLKNLTSQQLPSTSDYSYNSSTWSRLHKRRNPLNSNANRPKSCYGSANQQEIESNRPKSMILCESKSNRDSKLLDTNIFAQITPPLLQRKFAASQPAIQKLEDPPQIRVKQIPKRETPVLKPKIMSNRPFKLQKAELRTILPSSSAALASPKTTPKLNAKQTTQPGIKPWQQSFNSSSTKRQFNQDSTIQCSNDVPRFSINTTKMSSPGQSRVANAVRSLNSTLSTQKTETLPTNYDKWKKNNIASVSPMPKTTNPYISNGSTTFPAARKHNQMPLVGLASIAKPQTMVQAQPQKTFTSSCSIALGASFKKQNDQGFGRMRRQNEWHVSEKL